MQQNACSVPLLLGSLAVLKDLRAVSQNCETDVMMHLLPSPAIPGPDQSSSRSERRNKQFLVATEPQIGNEDKL